jgi:pimeloyl-ACP methyl ester carboxylesterase
LLFIDALGFGRSPWPPVKHTLEDHLGFLRRTLVADGATSRLTVVGYSLGALVASEYAAAFPRDIERLVLLGAPVFRSERDARARVREMSSLGAAFSLSPVLARESCQFICALRPVLIRLAPTLLPDLPDAVAEDAVLHYWGSFHGTVENVLLRTRLEETLRRLPAEVDVVLVHGRSDTVTDLSRIRELSRIVGARLVVVEGGHRDYVGHAGLISKIVKSSAPAERRTTP